MRSVILPPSLAAWALCRPLLDHVGAVGRLCHDGSDLVGRNGFLFPVLKHGPRSLACVRVRGC